MMTQRLTTSLCTLAVLMGLSDCSSDQSATAKLEAGAKIPRATAEKTALAKVPGGTITGGGIEQDGGKLLWSFDVSTAGTNGTTEVEVDALTGAVLSADHEAAEAPSGASGNGGDADDEKAGAGDEKDEVVTMAQVPAAVKATVKPFAADSEIKKVEKGDDDGTQAYEFDIEHGGRKLEVTITPDGKLLGTEETVALSTAPGPVRKTITAQAVGGTIVSVEKVNESGKTTYEAVVDKQGKKSEIAVGLDGALLPPEAKDGGK